jgi:hypothetical protein
MKVLLVSNGSYEVVEAVTPAHAVFAAQAQALRALNRPIPKFTAFPERLQSTKVRVVLKEPNGVVCFHSNFGGIKLPVEFRYLEDLEPVPKTLFNPYATTADDFNGPVVLQLIAEDGQVTPYGQMLASL